MATWFFIGAIVEVIFLLVDYFIWKARFEKDVEEDFKKNPAKLLFYLIFLALCFPLIIAIEINEVYIRLKRRKGMKKISKESIYLSLAWILFFVWTIALCLFEVNN